MKKHLLSILIPLLCGFKPLVAQISIQNPNESIAICKSDDCVYLTDFGNNVLNVSRQPISNNLSQGIVAQSQIREWNSNIHDGSVLLDFGNHLIEVDTSTLSIEIKKGEQVVLSERSGLLKNADTTTVTFENNASDNILGSGARPFGLNFQGKVFNMRNTYQGNYYENATTFEQSINLPVLFNLHKYAILFDSKLPGNVRFDIGGFNEETWAFRSIGEGQWSYFVILGETNDSIIKSYTHLTGRQPMPPRWSLGVLQSKFAYRTTQEVVNISNLYKRQNFPLDAVLLDFPWQNQVGDFRFNDSTFNGIAPILENLKDEGIHTILRLDPFVVSTSANFSFANENRLFAKNTRQETQLVNFENQNAGVIDVFNSGTNDFIDQNLNLLESTVDIAAYWSENNEPNLISNSSLVGNTTLGAVRNWYSDSWLRILANRNTSKRPFQIARSAYVGSQRTGVFPRTGDVTRYWAGFKLQIPIILNASLSGLAYTHSDIGGYATGPGKNQEDDELDLRWLQMSVFSPAVRFHGFRNITDPLRLSDPFYGYAQDALRLRYRLMPYIYTLAWQNSQTGRPLCMPSNYFDNNSNVSDRTDQYLFGENLLVAPVILHGQPLRRIDLPEGTWFDYWNGEKYTGGQAIFKELTLENIPVLAKAGAIIPNAITSANSLMNYSTDSLEVQFFQDPSVLTSSFKMYDDDGEHTTLSEFDLIEFTGESNETDISLKGEYEINRYASKPKVLRIVVKNISSIPSSVLLDGRELGLVFFKDNLSSQNAFYDLENKELVLELTWANSDGFELNIKRDANEWLLSNAIFETKPFVPNPTSNFVYIKDEGIIDFDVIANQGFSMKSVVKREGNRLDFSNLIPAVYVVVVKLDNGQLLAQKIIKQ